jgi:hypothetical protein
MTTHDTQKPQPGVKSTDAPVDRPMDQRPKQADAEVSKALMAMATEDSDDLFDNVPV